MNALIPNSVCVLGTEADRKCRERKLHDGLDVKVREMQRFTGCFIDGGVPVEKPVSG